MRFGAKELRCPTLLKSSRFEYSPRSFAHSEAVKPDAYVPPPKKSLFNQTIVFGAVARLGIATVGAYNAIPRWHRSSLLISTVDGRESVGVSVVREVMKLVRRD